MTTVLSTCNNPDLGTHRQQQSQQNRQIYAELFSKDNTGLTEVSPKFTEPDSDLSNVVRKAVSLLKNKADDILTAMSSCNIKYHCGICKKIVNKNQKAINCSVCSEWVHIKCNRVSVNEYEKLVEEESIPWQCILCHIEDMASKFPFCYLSKTELIDLYGLDFPSQLQLLPTYELRSKLSKIPSLDNFDVDENHIQSVSSKYYNLSDLTKLNFPFGKSFSFFHVNTRSLSKNFDQLLSILSASNISFDVLGITKQEIDKGFLTSVSIDGYHMYTQPSKSLAGGVAIYVKTNMKMLWTGIRSIVNVKVKTQFSNISHLLDNGTRVNDPVKMANLFNNYFVNVDLNIDKTIPRTTKSPTDYLKDRIS